VLNSVHFAFCMQLLSLTETLTNSQPIFTTSQDFLYRLEITDCLVFPIYPTLSTLRRYFYRAVLVGLLRLWLAATWSLICCPITGACSDAVFCIALLHLNHECGSANIGGMPISPRCVGGYNGLFISQSSLQNEQDYHTFQQNKHLVSRLFVNHRTIPVIEGKAHIAFETLQPKSSLPYVAWQQSSI
jgi:hypothetical protein